MKIEERNGLLRLRWSYAGDRYYLALGLKITKVNQKAARQKAEQIELDIASGNFDPTLAKYKPKPVKPKPEKQVRLPVVVLFQQFIDYKSKSLYRRSIEKYKTLFRDLQQFFGEKKLAFSVSVKDAESFKSWLSLRLAAFTLKERLTLLKACWQWGIKQGLTKENPWSELPSRIKVPPKPLPKPFSKSELLAIFEAFKNHKDYCYYLPFVQFRAWSGTRISEAIGLRWQDVADDFSQIWIGSSLSRGERKPTKTNRSRIIPCNTRLKELLRSIVPVNPKPEQLVFPSPNGVAIRDSEFGKRAWRTCLKLAGVKYRSFYRLRHTFISHCLDAGMSPVVIAEITGHDLEVLFQHYAGSVGGRSIPEF